MRKIFQRTSYQRKLEGVCNVINPENWFSDFGLYGFTSKFDGGMNTHNPSEFCVLFVEIDVPEGGEFGKDYMVPRKILMLRRHESFLQDPNDQNWEGFYSIPNPEKISAEELSGDWWELFGRDTRVLDEEKIEDIDKTILKKGLQKIRNLYGQGNQDGLWGPPSRKNKKRSRK